MKKIISLLLAVFISICSVLPMDSYAAETPVLQSKYAVLMDYETGNVLFEKNGNSKLYPASTTKAWTAYLVIKHVDNLNERITIGNLPYIEPSSMFLKKGESFTVKELLSALMVHSCNDVAYVLAEHVGGSVSGFADIMNKEAKAIGCTGTHFNNPNGLPDTNHYTTAHDMALMARKAMNNPTFREIVSTKHLTIEATEQYPQKRIYDNSNKFLTSNATMNYKGKSIPIKYDIVDGIKTGFTNAAGKCLLTSAKKGNQRVIAAVFQSTNEGVYVDSRTLIDYGFENFDSHVIADKDEYTDTKRKFFTKQKELIYQPEEGYAVLTKNGEPLDGKYSVNTKLNKIELPVKKGDVVGSMTISKNGEKMRSINLIAQNNLDSIFGKLIENKLFLLLLLIIKLIVIAAILFLAFIFIAKYYYSYKRKNKGNRRKVNRNSNNTSERPHRPVNHRDPVSEEKENKIRRRPAEKINRNTDREQIKRKPKK